MHRKTIALSPTQMRERRQTVQKIREGLSEFVYDQSEKFFGPTCEVREE